MAGSVFVFGASGHAKVVIDIFERMKGTKVVFVIDDADDKQGRTLCGYPVIGGRDALLANRRRVKAGIVAIGDNGGRARVAAWLAEHGVRAARLRDGDHAGAGRGAGDALHRRLL